jgi:hypothetical protein
LHGSIVAAALSNNRLEAGWGQSVVGLVIVSNRHIIVAAVSNRITTIMLQALTATAHTAATL